MNNTTADTTRHAPLDIIVNFGEALDATNADFTIVDDNGDDIDLTNYTDATLKVYKKTFSSSETLLFDTGDNSLILAVGSFGLRKTAADLVAATRGAYYFKFLADDKVLVAKGQYIIK
jgi:hypothetical protein